MPTNGQCSASILVDGVPLEEYDLKQKDTTYSCWIGSETGKNFVVHFERAPSTGNEHLALYVYMDGNYVKGLVVYPKPETQSWDIRGAQIGPRTIRPFAFGPVSLTDDETIAPVDRQYSDLGLIEMKIFRILVNGPTQWTDRKENMPGGKVIHERSKKMSTHQVALQEPESCPAVNVVDVSKLDPGPSAVFSFRYRPKDFLRAQGIAPSENTRSHSPTDENASSSSSSSSSGSKKRKRNQRRSGSTSDEENEEAQQEIRSIEQQMADMQSRLNSLRNRSGNTVKTEVKREPFVSFPILSDGVIDLTDD